MNGADFRGIRKELGLTQTQIGKRLGDDRGGYALRTVQSWEAGTAPIPPAVRVLVRYMIAA